MATTLALPIGRDGGDTLVEVAVDAPAGPGPRTYTYAVPAALGALEPGEPVLVPFGRGGRQAIGIVVGPGSPVVAGGAELRPVAAKVRSDGPLLPPLALRFAASIADRYLAPLATVIRAMLPPGMLERLELVAEVTPAGEARLGQADPGLGAVDLDLLDELAGRPRPVRDLSTPGGPGGPAPAAPRAGRRGPRRPDLDPARGGRRAAIRAPPVGHARGRGRGRAAAGRGAPPGASARAAPGRGAG